MNPRWPRPHGIGTPGMGTRTWFFLCAVSNSVLVRPGAPSSVLAPSSDALCSVLASFVSHFLFLVDSSHPNRSLWLPDPQPTALPVSEAHFSTPFIS